MKKNNWLKLIAVMVMALCLIACGNQTAGNGGNAVENVKANEADFAWEGDYIYALSDAGMAKEIIVIPARCKGFSDNVFDEDGVTKEVVFAGEDHIDIDGQFSFVTTLESVTLPAGQRVIPVRSFSGCSGLERFSVPAAITDIEDEAFQLADTLKSVKFEGNELTTIGSRAFSCCTALTDIELPYSVEEIGEFAFENCYSLKKFTLPASIKVIGEYAFVGTDLTDLYIPGDVVIESMGAYAFSPSEELMKIHVTEGSWVDEHFDELFDFSCEKVYD